MKRNNPETGAPFVFGDVRQDGYVFWGYESAIKRDGYFREAWRHPDKFANQRSKSNKHKRQHRQTKEGRMLALVHAARHSSKKRGHDAPTITPQTLLDLWDKQQGLCAYTKWPMTFETKTDHLVSLERINNAHGYVDGNIVLVCWCVNSARSDMDQAQFFAMCKAIAEHCK